jgi:hypothetical protein
MVASSRKRCAHVDQDGLALACYREAELLKPELYFEPPGAMIVLPGRIGRHLAILREVQAANSAAT